MDQRYQTRPVLQDLGDHGWLEGRELLSQVTSTPIARYFGGVRYAQAPTRFRRAKALPLDYKYGTKTAPEPCLEDCNVCPQPDWPGVLEPSDRAKWHEDCVQTNIWVPAGEPPAGGWPVLFHIHGGFLQFGEPNKAVEVVANMYEGTRFRAIVVMPAYRVNMFGFLAGEELEREAWLEGEHAGNTGFWDQRTALEWTARVVSRFGGDPSNIAVSGYSAGAHSVFHQLSHDLFLPPQESRIRRAIMWSNGSGVQPRNAAEHQESFDELVALLGVPSSAPASEKLAALRTAPAAELVGCIDKLRNSQFRATSDGDFVSATLVRDISSGVYGRRMKDRGVQLMIGDCRDEHNLYRAWRTPKDSGASLRARLAEDYPGHIVDSVLNHYAPNGKLPSEYTDWTVLFGHVYANLQVHCLERGFVKQLVAAGCVPGQDVFRYRIERRFGCADAFLPAEWRVTHATDDALWWWGNNWAEGLTDAEKDMARPLFELFASYVQGEDMAGWATSRAEEVLRLTQSGEMDVWLDEHWERSLKVWDLVNGIGQQALPN